MATEFNITKEHRFFLGEDKVLRLKVYEQDGTTPINVDGWSLLYVLRKKDKDPDPPILSKTTTGSSPKISIEGTFNIDPEANMQVVLVTFDSDDTTNLEAKTYRYSIKRTDSGNERILTYGGQEFLQATAH